MRFRHTSLAPTGRSASAAALLCGLCLLMPAGAYALGPSSDARETTYLEYSRNLVAAYPEALGRRVRQMQRRASTPLSAIETCRRAVNRVPGDLEENPHRRIALVAAGPIGRAPDAWERQALARLSASGERTAHAFVDMAPDDDGPTRQVFRYIEPLAGLPEPCGALLEDTGAGPAVSIMRQGGTAEGDARPRSPEVTAPTLRLPPPKRQGPRR